MNYFMQVLVAFALFSAIHSIFAVPAFRDQLQQWLHLSAKCYRLLYNMKSVLLLLIIYLLVPPSPKVLYALDGAGRWLLHGVQTVAAILFLLGLRDFNTRAFLGLPGADTDRDELNTGGFFRYCRHPLYSASMLFVIANPVMTLGWAAYGFSIILYFFIGSIFEERHLEARFGADYRKYKQAVPRFIPRLWRLFR